MLLVKLYNNFYKKPIYVHVCSRIPLENLTVKDVLLYYDITTEKENRKGKYI